MKIQSIYYLIHNYAGNPLVMKPVTTADPLVIKAILDHTPDPEGLILPRYIPELGITIMRMTARKSDAETEEKD